MKNSRTTLQRQQLARSFILLAFALFIAHLSKSGTLHYYIAPKMEPWLRYCAIPLAAMSLCLAREALFHSHPSACGCEHHAAASRFKSAATYALFLLPLLLGVLLPDQALGSMAANKKGMQLSSPALSSEHLNDIFVSPDKYNAEFAELAKKLYPQDIIEVKPEIYSETIGAIELFKEQFRGKTVMLSGFVYEDPSLDGAREFIIGRFLVQCCTADAYPFGVLVASAQPLPLFEPDAWIEVQGTVQTRLRDGREIIAISAEEVRKIPRPTTPYVYPNDRPLEAFDELTRH
ncbi:TIGR03943 family putative permease subunit [Paenibacillus ihumii]|uniref:TIGR03943 family putative permease subunit n=1 Tax=Paenibacillus ihumii TaxID=687436 RepID=UPI0006D7ECD7|nr:TIGR03943 family protein [Paenibacillus ihumii]